MVRKYVCSKDVELSETDEWTLIDFPAQHVQLSFPNPKSVVFDGYMLYETGSERLEKLTLVAGHKSLDFEFVTRYNRNLGGIYHICNAEYVNFFVTEAQMHDIYKFYGHPDPKTAVGEGFVPRALPIQEEEVVCSQ